MVELQYWKEEFIPAFYHTVELPCHAANKDMWKRTPLDMARFSFEETYFPQLATSIICILLTKKIFDCEPKFGHVFLHFGDILINLCVKVFKKNNYDGSI